MSSAGTIKSVWKLTCQGFCTQVPGKLVRIHLMGLVFVGQ